MSAPRRGLGRGLGALLGDSVPTAGDREPPREIPVDRITPNPYQPRKSFEREPLDELRASISEYGVLVPIIVRRRGEGYELIAGERRWRACASLGLTSVPAILRASDDRDALEVALIENLQRENLNPLEEAAGLQHLIDEFGLTQEDVARRVGKSRPAVTNALRLLALPEGVKAMLADGRLSPGHARALLAAAPADREALAERAVRGALTVRALERIAAQETASEPAPRATMRALTNDEQSFENRLRERFATHVALVRYGRGGRIEFRFSNEDDLMRLGDLLLADDAPS